MQAEKHSLAHRDQGFPATNTSRPLDIKVGADAVSQEVLLDHYMRGFQALQSIAQAIPQQKQSQDALTPLSKDRVEDFARSFSAKETTLRSPSAFRPVPSKGACMLFERDPRIEAKGFGSEGTVNEGLGGKGLVSGGFRQPSGPLPSLLELDEALELSLNPVPKFGILMARVDAASRDESHVGSEARDGNGAGIGVGLDYGISPREQLPTSLYRTPKVFETNVGRLDVSCARPGQGFDPLWGIEGLARLRETPEGSRESPKGQAFAVSPSGAQGGFARGGASPTRAGEKLEANGGVSSKWCGTLLTEAWPGGGKRKREEPQIEGEELVKLLQWMERSTNGIDSRTGGTPVPTLDGVLERLEEMLGFRRRGGGVDLLQGAMERPNTSSGAIQQVVLDINELTGMKDAIRTVPLGRGWEEDCIRRVLEQIIWQGATGGKKVCSNAANQNSGGNAKASLLEL